jgi:UDP-N-acetylmuramyl pentapeptide phosphotransferase/UDP-N-acetylglucosamine-1-phosphate transferase
MSEWSLSLTVAAIVVVIALASACWWLAVMVDAWIDRHTEERKIPRFGKLFFLAGVVFLVLLVPLFNHAFYVTSDPANFGWVLIVAILWVILWGCLILGDHVFPRWARQHKFIAHTPSE